MHHLKRREAIDPVPHYESRSDGFTRCALVDGDAGSVHMGLGYCRLEDGHVDEHVQSYEESFFVLEGEPVLYLDGRGYQLARGACGVVPVGVPHAWRAEGEASLDRHAGAAAAPPGREAGHVLRRAGAVVGDRCRSTSAIRARATSSGSRTGRWTSTT